MISEQESNEAFLFRASIANAVITSAPLYEALGAASAMVSRLLEPGLTGVGDHELNDVTGNVESSIATAVQMSSRNTVR